MQKESHTQADKVPEEGNLISNNGFAVLADLDGVEDEQDDRVGQALETNIPLEGEQAHNLADCRVDMVTGNESNLGVLGISQPLGLIARPETSDTGSSQSLPPMSGKKVGKNKQVIPKEYFLRNKVVYNNGGARVASSPPHDTSYAITSNVDSDALASMKMVANKNWADQCEEEEYPLKHGSKRVER